MDRIEQINELIETKYIKQRKQSVVVNNFYSILTIGMVCISILFYTHYIVPAQKNKQQRELKQKQHQQYLLQRQKQIELSHKLNIKEH